MTWRSVLGAALAIALAACSERGPPDGPWFRDEAEQRGIDFVHRSGFAERPLLPEIVGGGAALADVDNDGDLDAYLVQSGWRLDGSAQDRAAAPGNVLYINRGDGHFTARPDAAADTGYGMGVAPGDYDNDGDVDFYVTNVGANALLRNDGTGVFENVAVAAGVADPGWGTGAAFMDFDIDGDLDLFLVNYIDWSLATEKDCRSRGKRTYCSPTTYNAPAMDRLFRNNGDGTFTDATVQAGIHRAYGNGLGIVTADFNDDGLVDVFVANDKTVNQLWLNEGGLAFKEVAAQWGCAVDEHGIAKAGMGVGAADVDDDGDRDLLVVNLGGETDSYFRNEGGHFRDASAATGLGAQSRRYTRFGIALADFDNDGALDLYQANGKVDGDADADEDAFAEPNVVYWRGYIKDRGTVFTAIPNGGTRTPLVHTSRAVAVGDVDGDGGQDLLVVNRDAPAYLLMNRLRKRGDWIRFRVLDGGRDALGATVSIVPSRYNTPHRERDVQVASSYLAGNEPHVHFGLLGRRGSRLVHDVRVRWPGGEEEDFGDFPAGMTAVLRRGAGGTGLGVGIGLPTRHEDVVR